MEDSVDNVAKQARLSSLIGNIGIGQKRKTVADKDTIRRVLKDIQERKSRVRADVNQQPEGGPRGKKPDVCEIYSPPRVMRQAATLGLREGWALDLQTVDEDDGKPWDFDDVRKETKPLERYIKTSQRC